MPTRASVLTGGGGSSQTMPTEDLFRRGTKWAGTGQQNQLLAQAMGFDPNKSIIDQMQGFGADSSYANRGNMWQNYMQGNIKSPIMQKYLEGLGGG